MYVRQALTRGAHDIVYMWRARVYVCGCVYACMWACVGVSVCMHVRVCVGVWVCVWVWVWVWVCVCLRVHSASYPHHRTCVHASRLTGVGERPGGAQNPKLLGTVRTFRGGWKTAVALARHRPWPSESGGAG